MDSTTEPPNSFSLLSVPASMESADSVVLEDFVEEKLEDYLENGKTSVLLDMSQGILSSGTLVTRVHRWTRWVKREGGELALVGVPEECMPSFENAGILNECRFFTDLAAAKEGLVLIDNVAGEGAEESLEALSQVAAPVDGESEELESVMEGITQYIDEDMEKEQADESNYQESMDSIMAELQSSEQEPSDSDKSDKDLPDEKGELSVGQEKESNVEDDEEVKSVVDGTEENLDSSEITEEQETPISDDNSEDVNEILQENSDEERVQHTEVAQSDEVEGSAESSSDENIESPLDSLEESESSTDDNIPDLDSRDEVSETLESPEQVEEKEVSPSSLDGEEEQLETESEELPSGYYNVMGECANAGVEEGVLDDMENVVLEENLSEDTENDVVENEQESVSAAEKQVDEVEPSLESGSSYTLPDDINNIGTSVVKSGEYQCMGCGSLDYFLKGTKFHNCKEKKCPGSNDGWNLTCLIF